MPASPNQTLLIMWASFVMSHVLITAVPFLAQMQPGGGNGTVALVLPAFALLCGTASLMARAWLRTPNVQTAYIIRWALAESATLFGLVSWYMTGSHTTQYACAAIGLLAHVMAYPREQ